MIVNCDKCGAKFQLADDKVTDKGTKVRCSKCKAIFTVKKGDEKAAPAAPPAPAKPTPPPKPVAPAAKAEPGKKGDDPFSDFNFSDDLDFGDQEINVKPKKEEPEKGFLDSVPSAPIPTKAAAPAPAAPPADDGGFDFSDEEFSLSEPEPPKPVKAPPPPAPKPIAPPPKPAAPAKKAEADEFGDFKFDDESFSEPGGGAPAPAPAGPAPAPRINGSGGAGAASAPASAPGGGRGGGGGGSEEWGNVSIGDEEPAPKSKPGGEEMDDTGFGDFKFDDGSSGEKDDEIDMDSFKRSEKSKAPVRDDLEASIGDGDAEPESPKPAARKAEPSEPPPPPPKPTIKREKKEPSGGGWIKWVIIAVIFLGAIFGGVGYTSSQGWFSYGDLFTLKFKKLGDIPAVNDYLIKNGYRKEPKIGDVVVVDERKTTYIPREDMNGLTLIVVKGQVANRTNKVMTGIKVQGTLKNGDGDIVATTTSYCGVAFTDEELRTMSRERITDITTTTFGRDSKCEEVPPDTVLDYTLVFFDYPADTKLKWGNASVAESKVLGE